MSKQLQTIGYVLATPEPATIVDVGLDSEEDFISKQIKDVGGADFWKTMLADGYTVRRVLIREAPHV